MASNNLDIEWINNLRDPTLLGFKNRVADRCDIRLADIKIAMARRIFTLYNCSADGFDVIISELIEGVANKLFGGYTAVTLVIANITCHWTEHAFRKILDIVLAAGANINCTDIRNVSPLQYAVHLNVDRGFAQTVVEILLERGADPSINPLGLFGHIRWYRNDMKSVLDVLKRYGFRPDFSRGPKDRAHLRDICRNMPLVDCEWFLDWLLAHGLRPQTSPYLLDLAICGDKISLELLRRLIDIGVPVIWEGKLHKYGPEITREHLAAMRILLDAAEAVL